MLKRILFTLLTLLVIYSGALIAYRMNEPEKEEIIGFAGEDDVLIYSGLEDYTLSSGASARHYYFFCTPYSNDCIYMETTVLKTVEKDTGLDMKQILEYVDVSDAGNMNAMKDQWSVSGYPAFVACHVENGNVVVDSSIESTVKVPLSAENVEAWLLYNGLYESGFDAPLETAAP